MSKVTKKPVVRKVYGVDDKCYCRKCMKTKSPTEFYEATNSNLDSNNFMSICRDCCTSIYDNYFSLHNNMEKSLYLTCKDLDVCFSPDAMIAATSHMESLIAKGIKAEKVFGYYKSKLSSTVKTNGVDSFAFSDTPITREEAQILKANENVITDESILKWGEGYDADEYVSFERKYEFLKNNYPEKTSMHTEALLKYIRYSVKEEISTAKNDVGAAKSWAAMAQTAATSAKINPSQLSAADLQDGLTGFGQLSRAVEQAVDVISILPKFREKPQDKVDFTLLCYINYVRELKGLGSCEYKDIYNFYEQKRKDYENRTLVEDDIVSGDNDGII
ncbi:MAG TPA: hypothetical protein VIK86_08030 [Candidatus Paceibacterota bacterium]